MRLTTWNVNGIRNPFSYPPWNAARSFPAMFDMLQSDIIVMQELKIQRKDLRDDMVLLDGWDCYFSLPKHKKGYSGVGIYTRNSACAPIRAEEGLLGFLPSAGSGGVLYRDLPEIEQIGGYPTALQVAELGLEDPAGLDAEGRCLLLEFSAFVLLGVYSPANSNGQRDDFRYGFICALDCRIRNLLRMGKRVVLVGDLNVSRDELDGASALEDRRKAGISHEDYISTPNRRIFNQLLLDGEVAGERDEGREAGVLLDTTRHFHPQRQGMYTHWEQKINARPGNFGSRIDFVLASDSMRTWIKDANIQEGLLGSDHCPVFAEFHDRVDTADGEVHLKDMMFPPGACVDGVLQQEWRVQDIPVFSGKKLQEFDRRRSIKSMFAKPLPEKITSTEEPGLPYQEDSIGGEGRNETSSGAKRLLTTGQSPQSAAVDQSQPPVDTTVPSISGRNQDAPERMGPAPSQTSSAPRLASNLSPEKKRKSADNGNASSTTSKRRKSGPTAAVAARKSQQSLKGFFQPKSTSNPSSNKPDLLAARNRSNTSDGRAALAADKHTSTQDHSGKADTMPTSRPQANDQPAQASPATALPPKDTPEPTSPAHSTASAFTASPSQASTTASPSEQYGLNAEAREATHHSWNSLFARPAAPLCEEHKEPCKSMQTKKKGSNQGRSFWMCARPLGPSGQKEKGTEWRCGTFVWCSDWKGG